MLTERSARLSPLKELGAGHRLLFFYQQTEEQLKRLDRIGSEAGCSTWQFAGEGKLQSTAMIAIMIGPLAVMDVCADAHMPCGCRPRCSRTGSNGGKTLS
jgi:hypothetical protein